MVHARHVPVDIAAIVRHTSEQLVCVANTLGRTEVVAETLGVPFVQGTVVVVLFPFRFGEDCAERG